MPAYGLGTYGLGLYGIGEEGGTVVVPRPKEPRHKAPGPLLCRVINPRGEWAYLNMFGRTSNLSFTWGTSGGPLFAEVSMDAPVDAYIPALIQGATFQVTRGAGIGWTGKVSEIAKGSPWQIKVDGLGGLATRETVLIEGDLAEIIQASIDDEFPWELAEDNGFEFVDWGTDDDPITTKLDEVLATALTIEGLRWTVNNQGVANTLPEPSTIPSLLIRVSDPSIPVSMNKYATRVRYRFNNADNGGAPETGFVKSDEAEEKFGRVLVDISLGKVVSYSEAAAEAKALNFLSRVSPRLTLTGAFTVTNGQITTSTGAPVDIAKVSDISGKVARLQFATPLRDALLGSVLSIDVQLGETTYDDDNATLSVAPVDAGLTPAQILFGARGGGNYDRKTGVVS